MWDIVPQLTERREADRDRRVAITPIAFADRRIESRRFSLPRRAVLREPYAQGWLCFDSGREKRRLTPIPGDWMTCSERRLELYVGRAERASGVYHAIPEPPGPLAEAG